jgi:hypothetical protein
LSVSHGLHDPDGAEQEHVAPHAPKQPPGPTAYHPPPDAEQMYEQTPVQDWGHGVVVVGGITTHPVLVVAPQEHPGAGRAQMFPHGAQEAETKYHWFPIPQIHEQPEQLGVVVVLVVSQLQALGAQVVVVDVVLVVVEQ